MLTIPRFAGWRAWCLCMGTALLGLTSTAARAESQGAANSLTQRNPDLLHRADPWVYKHTGGYYRLVNVASGKCLGIAGASTADGAAADIETCTGATKWTGNGYAPQRWRLGRLD